MSSVIAEKGIRSLYVLDHLIRAYRGRRADLCRDLGRPDDCSIHVVAGIGTWYATPSGETFDSNARAAPAPLSPPSTETIAARLAACHACDRYRPESDRCGQCGCASEITQRAASPVQSCPLDRWPITPPASAAAH